MGIASTQIISRKEAIWKIMEVYEEKLNKKSTEELDKLVNKYNDDIFVNYLVEEKGE